MAIAHARGFRPHVSRESDWYWPIAESLARFDGLDRFPTADELSALYAEQNGALGLPISFERAPKHKPKRRGPPNVSELYEGRIVERGTVPTRADDWHDLFNSLAFITFPRAKRALHTRQYEIWKQRIGPDAKRLPNARTREQDALSLFDEGGLCVVAPRGRALTVEAALETDESYLVPFGHALYEHLVAGLPCPLATPYLIELEEHELARCSLLAAVDRELAQALGKASEFRAPSGVRGSSLDTLTVRCPR
jgi:hypothetical protein